MEVQYYPPYIPPDPAMALEDNLRRAYPAPPDLPPDRLADLLRRDARWLNAQQMAAIDNIAVISLRAPGGKRIDAPAGPLKAIVGAIEARFGSLKKSKDNSSLTYTAPVARPGGNGNGKIF